MSQSSKTPTHPFTFKHFVAHDERGSFQKTFSSSLPPCVENFQPKESFLSFSHQGALRGMHFQAPPHDHAKCVSCLSGSIFDVVLDIRPGITFGETFTFTLHQGDSVFIPTGFAHGFYALSETITSYLVDSEHNADHDRGIHWQSIGVEWPAANPVISKRDAGFISLSSFTSPFSE